MHIGKVILLIVIVFLVPEIHAQVSISISDEEDQVYVTAVAWSHEGSKIVSVGLQFGGLRGFLQVFDLATNETLYMLHPEPGGFASVAWSPDDRYIAAGGYDQVIWVIDVIAREHVATLQGHQSTVSAVNWNVDGTRLVSGGNWDQFVVLWDMTTYTELRRIEAGDIRSVAYSPDNRQIAVGSLFGLGIFPASLDTSGINEPLPMWFSSLDIASVAWSHDGTRIAFGTLTTPSVTNPNMQRLARVYVLNRNNGTLLKDFATQTEAIFGLTWSPDDQLIATYSIDGSVNVWDVPSGVELGQFAGTNVFPADLNFSPYGGRLAYGLAINPAQQRQGASLLSHGIAIVVPISSLDRLNTIADACLRDANTSLVPHNTVLRAESAAELPALITQVEALPAEAIPAACAADLVAVARAIIGG
ncbi:MAG: hypothetical protein H7Y11_12810 [Armatimonadetes bacterium]|nr:hypothetical protein [Anaerolineae bacterium]